MARALQVIAILLALGLASVARAQTTTSTSSTTSTSLIDTHRCGVLAAAMTGTGATAIHVEVGFDRALWICTTVATGWTIEQSLDGGATWGTVSTQTATGCKDVQNPTRLYRVNLTTNGGEAKVQYCLTGSSSP